MGRDLERRRSNSLGGMVSSLSPGDVIERGVEGSSDDSKGVRSSVLDGWPRPFDDDAGGAIV